MQQTLVIWWRFGKEHGEGSGFRVNPTALIAEHLDKKVARFRNTPTAQWRWWRDGNILVERPDPDGNFYGPDSRIYYLVDQGLTIVENIHLPPPRQEWTWYIHLADIFYDEQRQCWINQDLFCDILLTRDGQRYHVMDLADLGTALQIGLLSATTASTILGRTDRVLTSIVQGDFPFVKVKQAQALSHRMGW